MISIVCPCYNEVDGIQLFVKTLYNHLLLSNYRFEIIVINDGSFDGSDIVLDARVQVLEHVRVIHFIRNYGHQSAILAGLVQSKGDAVITMDSDFQHPIEYVSKMIHLWELGNHIVFRIPSKREGQSFLKKMTSKSFYRILGLLSSQRVVIMGGNDFRLMDRKIVNLINKYKNEQLYIRGFLSELITANNTSKYHMKYSVFHYVLESRIFGKSKYTWTKMVDLAILAITRGTRLPLRWPFYFGVVSIILAILLIMQALYAYYIKSNTITGWTSLMIVSLFFFAVQCLLLSVFGEYLSKLYKHNLSLPSYIISEEDNLI